jgi:hypothetical protein
VPPHSTLASGAGAPPVAFATTAFAQRRPTPVVCGARSRQWRMARIAVVTIGRSNSPSAVSGLDSRSSRACRSNVSRPGAPVPCPAENREFARPKPPTCRRDSRSRQRPAGTENSVNLGQCRLQVEPVQCLPGENGVHRVFCYRDSLGSAVQCGHCRKQDRQLRAHLAVRFHRSYPSSGLHEACRQFSGSGRQIQYVLRVRRVGERNLGQSPLYCGGRIIRTVSGVGSRLCAEGTCPCRTVRTILGLICCAVAHHLNVVQRRREHPDW